MVDVSLIRQGRLYRRWLALGEPSKQARPQADASAASAGSVIPSDRALFPGWPSAREGFSTWGGSLRLLQSLVGKCFVLLTRSLSCPAQSRQVVARTGWRGRGQSCPNRKLLACCTLPAGLSRLGSALAAEAEFSDGEEGQSPALGTENRLLPHGIQLQCRRGWLRCSLAGLLLFPLLPNPGLLASVLFG